MKLRASVVYLMVPGEGWGGAHGLPSHPAEALEASVDSLVDGEAQHISAADSNTSG